MERLLSKGCISEDVESECQSRCEEIINCEKSGASFVGYTRNFPSLGPLMERNEQLKNGVKLPQIGSIVQVFNLEFFNRALIPSRSYTDEENEKRKVHLEPASGCMACRGEVKCYKVVKYTHGINEPFDSRNKMILDCVYPDYCIGAHNRMTLPTRFVASGVTVLKLVDNFKE